MKRAALLFGTAAMLASPLGGQVVPNPPEPFLMVTGMGEARIQTDRGRIEFMVETQAPTARQAAVQNAELMDRVMRSLRDAGGQTTTVETGGYSLEPVYRYPSREQPREIPVIEAYRAVNHVRVRADDVTRVGPLIDAGIGAGANRVASLTFEAKDPEPARMEALRQAVAKARAEAQTVAAALGDSLGRALEVHTSSDYGSPVINSGMMGRAAPEEMQVAPTPVAPGEQIVRANVTIKFALGG
jgi:uncharacterized protein YggE